MRYFLIVVAVVLLTAWLLSKIPHVPAMAPDQAWFSVR